MGLFSKLRNSLEDPLDIFGGKAQSEATAVQRQMSQEGLDLQRELFYRLFSDQAPVRESRDQAIGLLSQLQSGEFKPFLDPSMGFRRDQDIMDFRKMQAARGRLTAGDTFTGEQDINAQYEAGAVNDYINRLLNLAGFSTQDVANTNPILQNNVGMRGGIMQNMGNINAAGIMGNMGSRNQMLNTGAGIFGQIAGQRGWFGGGWNGSV